MGMFYAYHFAPMVISVSFSGLAGRKDGHLKEIKSHEDYQR